MTAKMQFDANAYYRAGHIPWTFFAFPRVLADDRGWPSDDDAKRLITALQNLGIPVGPWDTSLTPDTVYLACPQEELGHLCKATHRLEKQGEFEKGFCAQRSEFLFSWLERGVEPLLEPGEKRRHGSAE